MAKRPRVNHWIACDAISVIPPAGVYNLYSLHGVGPVRFVPGDVEFPASFEQFELFARFVGGRGVLSFEIEIVWHDSPRGAADTATFGPYVIHFRPPEPYRDYAFRITNLPFPGRGRFEFQLWVHARAERFHLASEFLEVRQLP